MTPNQLLVRSILASRKWGEEFGVINRLDALAGIARFLHDIGIKANAVSATLDFKTGSFGAAYMYVDGLKMDLLGGEGDQQIIDNVFEEWHRKPKIQFFEDIKEVNDTSWMFGDAQQKSNESYALCEAFVLENKTAPTQRKHNKTLRL